MAKIDTRIIQLARWHIPKDKSVLEYNRESTYLSIGYFDMINVFPGEEDENMSPLLLAYSNSNRHPNPSETSDGEIQLLENYNVQEMFLFTNILNTENDEGNGFTEKRIKEFWENKDLIIFVSLIHTDNDTEIESIISKIEKTFEDKMYLYYFSFDYSGIVLLAKGMKMREYLECMFDLNYNNSSKKIIRDSYSFFGFQKDGIKKIFDSLDNGNQIGDVFRENDNDIEKYEDTFSASVNIGIQNFNVYKEFIDKIKKYSPDVKTYALFGRHDVSIVMEEADLNWLIYVQYLLEKATIADGENSESENHLFSTHETFIKIKEIGNYEDVCISRPERNPSFNQFKKSLNNKIGEYLTLLKQGPLKYNGEYGIPIEAVKNSILSILKNRFAEDFVVCMYQSFDEFISYLLKKMEQDNNDIRMFDECFSEYFRGLNSLVNSAMHSERQFIQATAFNAIIYDAPSKIMAFYVALIDKFKELMRGEADMQYTFLLTPSFSNEISVKIFSYQQERPPHDRLLMVSINESSLYNPKEVIRRMAHEAAHFVGDNLRNRPLRKKHIKKSLIYIILSHVLHGSYLSVSEFFELIESLEEKISSITAYSDEKYNYSENLLEYLPDIADEFRFNSEIKTKLGQYIKDLLDSYMQGEYAQSDEYAEERDSLRTYILELVGTGRIMPEESIQRAYEEAYFSNTQIWVLSNLICADMEQELVIVNKDKDILRQKGRVSQSVISYEGSGVLNEKTVGEYVKALINIYAEAFADIQMILVTGFTFKEYLEGFVYEEKINVDDFENQIEDSSRISMVALALHISGIWSSLEVPEIEKNISEKEILVRKLQKKIIDQIIILKDSADMNEEIEEYRDCAKGFPGVIIQTEKKQDLLDSVTVMESGDNMMFYINKQLLFYLLECIRVSTAHYTLKADEMDNLKRTISIVSEFKDVSEVYSEICGVIKEYKQKIFKIEDNANL